MTFWILLHIKNNIVALWRTWRIISRRGKLSLRCWAFAWLRKCDEADVTFVQTRKTQSLYYYTLVGFVYTYHYIQFESQDSSLRDLCSYHHTDMETLDLLHCHIDLYMKVLMK